MSPFRQSPMWSAARRAGICVSQRPVGPNPADMPLDRIEVRAPRSGTMVSPHSAIARIDISKPKHPPVLRHYAVGPVGLLQWLMVTYPAIYNELKKNNPAFLQASAEITARMQKKCLGHCPRHNQLSGLGFTVDWASVQSAFSTGLKDLGSLVGVYGAIKGIKAAVSGQVAQQVAQATAGQPPLAYSAADNTATPSATPPSANIVTTPAPGHMSWMAIAGIGGLLAGGLYLLKHH